MLATDLPGELSVGSMNTVAQSGYCDQVTACKGQGAWMCFVDWDLAAVAGPCFETCTLSISAGWSLL